MRRLFAAVNIFASVSCLDDSEVISNISRTAASNRLNEIKTMRHDKQKSSSKYNRRDQRKLQGRIKSSKSKSPTIIGETTIVQTKSTRTSTSIKIEMIYPPPQPPSPAPYGQPPLSPVKLGAGIEKSCTAIPRPENMSKEITTSISLVFGGNAFFLLEKDVKIFETVLVDYFENLNQDWVYFQGCVEFTNQYALTTEQYVQHRETDPYNRHFRRNLENNDNNSYIDDFDTIISDTTIPRSGTGVSVKTSVYVDPLCNGCPDPQVLQLDDINLSTPSRRNLRETGNDCEFLIYCLRKRLPQYFNTVDDVMATDQSLSIENIVLCYLNWSIVMQDKAHFLTCEEYYLYSCGRIPEQCYCLDPCLPN